MAFWEVQLQQKNPRRLRCGPNTLRSPTCCFLSSTWSATKFLHIPVCFRFAPSSNTKFFSTASSGTASYCCGHLAVGWSMAIIDSRSHTVPVQHPQPHRRRSCFPRRSEWSLYILKCLQFSHSNVVRMNLTVYPSYHGSLLRQLYSRYFQGLKLQSCPVSLYLLLFANVAANISHSPFVNM